MPKIELNNFICKICKKRHDDNSVYNHEKTINKKELMMCPVCDCIGMAEYITGRHKKTKTHIYGKFKRKNEIRTVMEKQIDTKKEKHYDIKQSLTIYFD